MSTTWLEKLSDIGNRFSNLKVIKSITGGFKFGMPLIFIGAVFQIIENILQVFLGDTAPLIGSLDIARNLTFGILGLAWAFGIAYSDAKENKINANTAGLLSVSLFLILIKPVLTPISPMETTFQVNFARIGSMGSLVAILAGLVTGEGLNLFIKRGWIISTGKNNNIPDFINVWFESIIPGFVLIFIGWFLTYYLNLDIYDLTTKMMEPIVRATDTLLGLTIYEFLAIVGWFLAIHPLATFGWMIPILFGNLAENSQLHAAGMAPILGNGFHILNIGTEFGWILLFGSGVFLPLVFFALKSRSETLKNLGKVSLIPTLFSISEPILFGMPVAFNLILGIPMMIVTVVNCIITYFAMAWGLVAIPFNTTFIPFAPAGISGFLYNQDWRGIVLAAVLFLVNGLIYYPFFKIYEKQIIEQESKK